MPDGKSQSTPATCREKVASALFEFVYEGTGDDYRDFAARLWSELPYEKRRLWYRQADIALAAIGDQPHVE